MSDNNTYLRPEYTPLFSQIQDYIAEALNSDPQISATGIKFYPEHILDIEFQIKENLGKQGTVGIVNTLKGTYGGHNGTTQAWDIEAEIDIFENPSIRRAQMKKMGLSTGTTADLVDWVSESMCGPTSPTYGKFCAVRQQLGEDRGILVGKSIMKTYAVADVSGIVSGDYGWHIPYALWSDLSALSGQVMELSDIVISGISGDYLPLSGGEMSGDITFQSNNSLFWGDQNYHDAYIMGGSMGLAVYNDADEQWRFKSSALPESDDDVMRRRDLSAMTPYEIDQYETVIWRFNSIKEVVSLSGEVSLEDIEGLGDLSSIVAIDFGTGVSALGDYSCSALVNLRKVQCARTLRRIGEGAFYNSRAITLGGFVVDPQRDNYYYSQYNNIQTASKSLVVETSAFANCYYLSYVQLPNLFQTYIGEDAFKGIFQSSIFSGAYPQRGIFFYGTPTVALDSDSISAYNLSEVSSYVRGFNPTSYEWVNEQHYGKDFTYTNFEWASPGPSFAIASMKNKAFYYNPLSVAPLPSRARTRRVNIPELTDDHTAREIYAILSVQSDFNDSRIAKFTTGAPVDKYLNGDLSTFTSEFLKPGTKHFWHFFEYEPNKFYVEEMNTPPSYLSDYVKTTNTTPLTLTVPYDNGFSLQTPNGTPLLETIDLNRTSIYSLSTGNAEIASDGYLAKFSGAGVDTTKLSAWNWITTGGTSIGDIISGEHNAILGEVSEDFVSFNWLIQQGYATSAQVNEALSNYLPLSGGQMTGGISWDYGGMGGPTIYGPYNPQQLAFTTTYEPDVQKLIVLDFGRIEEAQGQRTIAFVEDIDAVLGDISALIHAT